MRRNLHSILVALSLLAAAFIIGCYAKHDDPPTYSNATPIQAMLAAQLQARDIGGLSFCVADTHSMEPLLYGGYYIVVDTHFPYEQVTKGVPVVYQADWRPKDSAPVVHRAQIKTGEDWLVEGDNVRPDIDPHTGADLRSEARWRMTKQTYIGKVVGIYSIPR